MEGSLRTHYAALFSELTKRERNASDEYDSLRGYKIKSYKGELKLSEADSILFFVSEGNVSEANRLKRELKRKEILKFVYRKRVEKYNELLAAVEQLRNIKKK